MTGAKERGPREVTVKTIAQGRPDDPAPPVVTTVCFLPMHTGRGCALSTRSSLRPLTFRGWFAQQLGRHLRRENADLYPHGSLKIQSFHRRPGQASDSER